MAGRQLPVRVTPEEREIILDAVRRHPHNWHLVILEIRNSVQHNPRLVGVYNRPHRQCVRRVYDEVRRNGQRLV